MATHARPAYQCAMHRTPTTAQTTTGPTAVGGGPWFWRQPYLMMVVPPVLWAGNITLGKYVAEDFPPLLLAQVRWSLAFLMLLPFGIRHVVRDWPVLKRHVPILILLSASGIAAYNTLVYIGLLETTALTAALLQSWQPMVIALLAFAIYRDRLTAGQAVGITLSFLGVLLILTRGDLARIAGFAFDRGDIWVAGGVFVYALYTVLLRSRPQVHPMALLLVLLGLGQAMLYPTTLWALAEGRRVEIDATMILTSIYVSLFASVIAYFCFNRGVQLLGANRASPFLHLVPVFGSAFAMIFLGERPQWFHAAGWLAIILGIAIAQGVVGRMAGQRDATRP